MRLVAQERRVLARAVHAVRAWRAVRVRVASLLQGQCAAHIIRRVILVLAPEGDLEQTRLLRLRNQERDDTRVAGRDHVGVRQRQRNGLVGVAALVVALEVRNVTGRNEVLKGHKTAAKTRINEWGFSGTVTRRGPGKANAPLETQQGHVQGRSSRTPGT